MAKTPLSVARSRASIGGVTGVYDLATLSADTYTKIGRIRNFPDFADVFQEISVEEVDDGRTRYGKGTASGDQMQLICSRQRSDPGQIKMGAAADSALAMNMKFEIVNEAGTFDVFYLSVTVMSKQVNMGGPNDTQRITYNCRPQEAPIEVPTA